MSGEATIDAVAGASVKDVAARLGGPVFTFAPQPHLELFSATPGLGSGRVVKMCMSYSFFRVPGRREDPRNFVELTAQQRAAIARVEKSGLPEALKDQVRRIRYPALFEAVRTSVPIPSERAHPLESRLEAHIVDVLGAMFPGRPRPERSPANEVPLRNLTVQRGVPITIDGESCRGFRVVSDPHLVAVGARVADRFFTAVVPSPLVSSISFTFVTL